MPAPYLFGANAATFALSALLIAGIGPRTRNVERAEYRSLWTDLRVGLQSLSGRSDVRLLLASSTAAVLFAGVTNVGEVILARDVLGTTGSGLAALVAADGLGTVLGSLAARFNRTLPVAPRVHRRALVHGDRPAACALWPQLWILLPVFVLGGFGNGFALVHDRLLLGDSVPEALHGRVFALQKALTSLAFAASFIGASVLISIGGVQSTFAIAAAGMLGTIALSAPRMRATWPAPAAAPVPA